MFAYCYMLYMLIATTALRLKASLGVNENHLGVHGWLQPNPVSVQRASLYGTVTPADQIKFESRYGAPYYQQHMKPKVVPNLLLLLCILVLFLFFIFW